MATHTTIELDSQIYSITAAKTTRVDPAPGRPLSNATPPSSNAPSSANIPRAWIVVIQLCGVSFVSSFSNGLLSIALPAMATALNIPANLLLWPSSVLFLTMGSVLLIAGSVADVIGPRKMNLPGTLLTVVMVLASGDIGFAPIFLSMPLGFAVGMIIGGLFDSTVGWKVGFYTAGAAGLLFFVVGTWVLPKDAKLGPFKATVKRLSVEIDWVGAAIASASIALLSYVLAMLSGATAHMEEPSDIALLVVSVLLRPAFAAWMRFRAKRGRSALIPNELVMEKSSRTSVCLMILLCNAVIICMELYSSLFFQEVIVGVTLSLLAGVLVNLLPVMASIMISSALAAGSPLIMALIEPSRNYWVMAFWAQILAPVQRGHAPHTLMQGYRAACWALFAWMIAACVIGMLGLKTVGKVGIKRE
ncbi:hypothetical protein CERZMDRAFT_109873 [Cercospora zeae-maydis SCOH1-5]|uniref:Major facilitator superfamily (MFS) profile domain-containing protein n=1 Tax=Cercospora zeae-maydis SCOH1-5 TaxID=717836 RepID=A0A6A6FRM7_9PEZI|nr:hypothetical protein CERZMDRAFT_109873 [Cercospora zeae-maydis SCOH1-5]